ncbi:HAD family hydrolase [uncultured Paraglaciecola sp.]|uniref:HAD family hydrolase n=1 Tax=uncultured Paraglaciecola sp. TaxID=1765024 RepID=UPI0030D9A400
MFDWGDTLMVDTPGQTGPMCDWPTVQAVDGAKACLQRLSRFSPCHLATNAEDSTEMQIRLALKRAGLSDYIQRIFCRENLGMGKTDADYYVAITEKLNVIPESITMVGDSLERDVQQAIKAGLKAVWFNPKNTQIQSNYTIITQLDKLI